jgi:tetratricopeptide (TPR) repeat protein
MLSLILAVQLVSVADAASTSVGTSARLVRLTQWIQAVEEHEAGTADEPVERARLWGRTELDEIRRDLRAVLGLIRRPRQDLFYDVDSSEVGPRVASIVYTQEEIEELRLLASAARGRGDANRLLKRGALLHTDIAMLAPPDAIDARGNPRPTSLREVTLQMDDGRQTGLVDSVGHLELARRLLDQVMLNPAKDDRPRPSSDEGVRLWYQATCATLLADENYSMRHFARAHELFPDDGVIQFIIGSVHETLAGDRTQAAVKSANMRGFRFDIQSERNELRLAELSLRRAVAAAPKLIEARLRLGHVLGLQGRAADAVKELRAAVSATEIPLLRYYGEMFLGRALSTLGEFDDARAAFERAAALYPRAPSPKIALSELAGRSGSRAAALALVREALDTDVNSDDEDEPLWSYDVVPGRSARMLLEEMIAAFPPRPR